MLMRGQTTEDRIGEIAAKFSQGLQGFAQSQQQEVAGMREERQYNDALAAKKLAYQAEAEKRQRGIEADKRALEKHETDMLINKAKANELTIPVEQSRDFKKALKVAEVTAGAKNATRDYESVDKMRKELSTLPVTKGLIDVDNALSKIYTAPPTAAGDMSTVFGYMKIQDPGSSVKEGEYASAKNAGGADDKAIAAYNSVLNGQLLSPAQREDFKRSAAKLAKSHYKTFMSATAPHRKRVFDLGLEPSHIFPGFANQGVYDAPDDPIEGASGGKPWEKYGGKK